MVDPSSPTTTTVNPLASIHGRIIELAHEDHLNRLNDEMKLKFADRFPMDLPHVNDIPHDIYHRIRLKDVSKTIKTRSYTCPRKYREAWGILLQQHLDAGWI